MPVNALPDLNLLLVFEAMLLHSNVTRAAAHIGLTQSAMSNALGRLRRQFDDPLFVNTPQRHAAHAARAGARAGRCTEALAMVRARSGRRERFDPRSRRARLRVYMTDVGEMVFLPPLVKRLDEHGADDAARDRAAAGRRARGAPGDPAKSTSPRATCRSCAKRSSARALFERALRLHDAPRASARPATRGLTLKEFLAARHVLIESMGSGHRNVERTLAEQGVQRERRAARAALHGGADDRRRHRPDRDRAEPRRRRSSRTLVKMRGASAADADPELRRLAVLACALREDPGDPVDARPDDRAVPADAQTQGHGARVCRKLKAGDRYMGYRVGIDVGGTFTDFALYDETTRRLAIHKVLTSPRDPSMPCLRGLDELTRSLGIAVSALTEAIHATTIATNTVIQRKGPRPRCSPPRASATSWSSAARNAGSSTTTTPTSRCRCCRASTSGRPRRLLHDGSEHTRLDEAAVRRPPAR